MDKEQNNLGQSDITIYTNNNNPSNLKNNILENKRKAEEKIEEEKRKLKESGYSIIESYKICDIYYIELYLNDNSPEDKKYIYKV